MDKNNHLGSSFNSVVVKKLDQFIRKYYSNQLLKGAIYVAAICMTAALVLILIEYFAHFNTVIRTVIFYFFIALFLGTIAKWIVIPLIGLYRLGNHLTYAQAAAIIGNHFSEVQDKLMNLLQLNDLHLKSEPDNVLLLASIEQKIEQIKPVPFNSAIDFRRNLVYIKYAAAPLLILLVLGLASPDMIMEPSKRIMNYESEFLPVAPFNFLIQNEDLKAVKNQDFKLDIKMTGKILPKEVYIELNGRKERLIKEDATAFKYVFKNLQESVNFKLYAEGFYSERKQLTVLPNPVLLSFEAALDYPNYLGLKDETVKNIGDLTLPEGTKINWKFTTENSSSLGVLINDELITAKKKESNSFDFELTARENLNYQIVTENEYHKNADAVGYVISVVPDKRPTISLNTQNDSLTAGTVHCFGKIEDDYGFSGLRFLYRKSNSKADGFQSMKVKYNKENNFSDYYFLLNMKSFDMAPGEEMEYYFEVADNDGVNGPKVSRTAMNWLKLSNLNELRDEAEKGLKDIKIELEAARQEAKKLNKELKKLSKNLIDKKDKGWEDQEQFESLLNQQKELRQKVEQLKDKYKKNSELTNEYEAYSEELIEKQQKLNELMEELMNDEMKETLEEIQKLVEEMDKEKLQDEIEKMALSSEELDKELDRSLELMKQLEFEKGLEEALEKVKDLEKKQGELKELTENGDKKDAKENAAKQEELNKEFEELRKEMEELREKNESLEFPNQLSSTEEQEREVSEEMKEGAEKMENGDNKNAPKNQQKAQEGMQSMAKSMEAAQAMMMEQQMEDLDNMRQLLDNVITASFDQESLMNELKELDNDDPKYVDAMVRQGEIRDNIELIKDSLFALSKRIVQLEPTVNREISAVNNSISASIAQLQERHTGQARRLQQLAMTSLNNLALLLDEVIQQMQMDMAMSMPGSGSCNKPGKGEGKKPKPSLSEMQKQLNQQLQKLKEGQGKGEKKGASENSGGSDGMSKELAKMAARQAAIREELRKMEAKDEGKNGGMSEEIKKISELMEQTETDIVNKQITAETLKRQEEITTRLLNSEKAERERELDKERKSNEFQGDLSLQETKFKEYYKKNENEVELLRTMIPSYRSFYKKKVSEYFKSLSE